MLTTTQSTLQTFSFGQNNIRIIMRDNEPWWCAADVCNVLGYTNGRKAVADHCSSRGVTKCYTLTSSGNQHLTYINEPNLYRLVARSHLPRAQAFETWIFEEVLPSIRRTGTYSLPADPEEQMIMLAEKLKEQALATRAAKQLLEKQRPKVELAERAICADNSQSMSDVAKELGIGRNKLFSLLREKKILTGNNTPYQKYLDAGFFEVKLRQVSIGATEQNKPVTRVRPKGLAFLSRQLKEVSCDTGK